MMSTRRSLLSACVPLLVLLLFPGSVGVAVAQTGPAPAIDGEATAVVIDHSSVRLRMDGSEYGRPYQRHRIRGGLRQVFRRRATA